MVIGCRSILSNKKRVCPFQALSKAGTNPFINSSALSAPVFYLGWCTCDPSISVELLQAHHRNRFLHSSSQGQPVVSLQSLPSAGQNMPASRQEGWKKRVSYPSGAINMAFPACIMLWFSEKKLPLPKKIRLVGRCLRLAWAGAKDPYCLGSLAPSVVAQQQEYLNRSVPKGSCPVPVSGRLVQEV